MSLRLSLLSATAMSVLPLANADLLGLRSDAPMPVRCIAVFEVMERAAPDWMAQPGVASAQASWEAVALDFEDRAGINLWSDVQTEMEALADITPEDPDLLTDLALRCVGDAPGAF